MTACSARRSGQGFSLSAAMRVRIHVDAWKMIAHSLGDTHCRCHTDGMQWPWARETSTSRYTHHDRYVHARGAISPGGSPRARLVLHGHRCSSTVVLTHTYGARVPSGRHNISRLPKTSCRARSSLMGGSVCHSRTSRRRARASCRPAALLVPWVWSLWEAQVRCARRPSWQWPRVRAAGAAAFLLLLVLVFLSSPRRTRDF
jgi:hypothetical protein